MIAMQLRTLRSNIFLDNDDDYGQVGKSTINELNLVYSQWGSADFLNNTNLNLPNIAGLSTVYSKPDEYVFSGIFNAAPEFGSYVKTQYPDSYEDLLLTYTQATSLLNEQTTDYQSLINPVNMKAFQLYIELEDWPSIFKRFTFTSQAQAEAF